MHIVQHPTPPFLITDGAARVYQIPVAHDNLCWVVACVATGRAAVVDGPPGSAPDVLALCEAEGLSLCAIWNTHVHWDHVGINNDLLKIGLPEGFQIVGAAKTADKIPGITHRVGEGDRITLGEITAEVWLTEGHIEGHLSFIVPGAVFCGDTMFTGGCGNLFGGPPGPMYRSLLRLASLPGDTAVCCAHDYTDDNLDFALFVEPDNAALIARMEGLQEIRENGGCAVPSTLEEERATNPFLRPGSPTLVARVKELGGVVDSFEQVFASTRALKDAGVHRRERQLS